jgi:hypothetical protein
MCGITGIYSQNIGMTERELFQSLLMLNVYRGKDSTGVVRINEPGKGSSAAIKRVVAPSPAFVTAKYGNDMIWDHDKKETKDHTKTIGYIGHCRAATKGEVKVQNAHPFRFNHTIGVHNGTIRWAFKGSSEYETDSEALYALVNEVGIEEALNEIRNASPAYALSWIDTQEGTLNFVRNLERPLWFTFLYAKGTLMWSSEWEMMDFALDRRSTRLSTSGFGKDNVGNDKGFFTIKENHLLSIPLGKSASEASIKPLNVKKGVTYTTGTTYVHGVNYDSWEDYANKNPSKGGSTSSDGYGNFRDKYGKEGITSLPWLSDEQKESSKDSSSGTQTAAAGNDKGTTIKATVGNSTGALVPLTPETKRHPHGQEPVHQSERNFRLSRGCFCCGNSVDPNDHAAASRVHWWNRQFFACGDCFDNASGETAWVRLAVEGEIPTELVELLGSDELSKVTIN